jgi:hypothetical protein
MKRRDVYVAYTQSLILVVVLIAVVMGVSIVVELVFVDFIHGNPHRTKANAVLMIMLYPPIVGLVAILGSFVVFTLPQCFQAIMSDVLARRLGRKGQFWILLALPLTVTLAWYCYDYLPPTVPNLGINVGADWPPYQHGLTLRRYLTMLIIQTPITLFSLAYCDAAVRHRSRKSIVLAAVVLALVVGVLHGYWMANGQYQFL